MTRVRSTHGAPCCGVLPGAEGDVDESNRGVASAIAGGLLVRVSEAPAAAEGGESLPSRAEALAMLEEIERRGTVITGLREELEAARNRVGQLEVEIAQLKLDLEAATAPSKDAKDPSAKKKSAATAEG